MLHIMLSKGNENVYIKHLRMRYTECMHTCSVNQSISDTGVKFPMQIQVVSSKPRSVPVQSASATVLQTVRGFYLREFLYKLVASNTFVGSTGLLMFDLQSIFPFEWLSYSWVTINWFMLFACLFGCFWVIHLSPI